MLFTVETKYHLIAYILITATNNNSVGNFDFTNLGNLKMKEHVMNSYTRYKLGDSRHNKIFACTVLVILCRNCPASRSHYYSDITRSKRDCKHPNKKRL